MASQTPTCLLFRRFKSSGTNTQIKWPRTPAPGDVVPWHDTGAAVRGFVLGQVFETFSARWDNAVRARGPYDALAGRISHRFSSAANHLKSTAVLQASRFNRRTVTFNSVVEANHAVDGASVAVTLPAGTAWAGNTGITHIKENYASALDAMEGLDSFVYIENQYFSDVDTAKKLFDRWRRNVDMPGPREACPPFCYILIPYEPQPTVDWTVSQGVHDIPEAEMKVLKWLELRSVREIWKRGSNGHWEPYCAVERPQNDVRFRGGVASDPSGLTETTQFEVNQAIALNADGSWQRDANGNPKRIQPNPVLEVGDVMTKGDIMTYTLVTTRAVQAAGGFTSLRPNVLSSEAIEDRLHIFCQRHQSYCHSKAATFFNRQHGRYVATLGSANLNPRSLDDRRDSQDSEMNIWWSGRRPVTEFRARLWTHHLRMTDPLAADERAWAENGWSNMIHIMQARGSALEGDVVRLDVVDRKQRF